MEYGEWNDNDLRSEGPGLINQMSAWGRMVQILNRAIWRKGTLC